MRKNESMYKVIGSFRSRTQRVLWAMLELELPFEWVNVAPGSSEAKAYNPTGKVPALIVDDKLLSDSEAILSFLCDFHNQLGFKAGTIERAKQDAKLAFANEFFDAPLWMQSRTQRLSGSVCEELSLATQSILQMGFARLEADFIEGTYLMGESFTIADIYTAHCLGWAKGEGHILPPSVLAYYRRCYARPAAKLMRETYS